MAGRPGARAAKQRQRLRVVPPGRDALDQGGSAQRANPRQRDGAGRAQSAPRGQGASGRTDAEALNDQAPGSATARGLLNQLRDRNGHPVAPALAGPITRAMILNERLFELFGEQKRRQDLIRFGQYTTRTDAASGIAGGKTASADYDVLFPIPQTQMDANPQLTQNPGY